MLMCLLIIFAFITSTFLLPAVITAEHVAERKSTVIHHGLTLVRALHSGTQP